MAQSAPQQTPQPLQPDGSDQATPPSDFMPTGPKPSGIETQQLTQLDAWSVGALTRSQGGFDASLWSGTDPAMLAIELDHVPANYESPAARDLARRVLLSGGAAPAGDAQAAARKRFEALGKMGAADELATMAAGAGPGLSDPVIAQYAAQAELARGRNPEACARGRAAVADPPPPFILRLRAYCAAVGGDRAAANLALDLIHGSGADDAWYQAAISAAAGAPGRRPPAARFDNSLTAQISLAAHLAPGANPLASASNMALLALVHADAAPQPVRAQATALAFRRGLISLGDARTVLQATPAGGAGIPPINAALRTVEASPGSLDAASAIATTLQASGAPADFYAVSRFFHDDIAALQQAPNAAATLTFARAAIAVGDTQLASRLMAIARQTTDPAALSPVEAAFAALRSRDGAPDPNAAKHRTDSAGASFAKQAARDVAVLGAIGFPLDASAQAFVTANPSTTGVHADTATMTQLGVAASRHSLGETALLAVLATGNGPARLDTPSLLAVLSALHSVGLDSDARRFAVEAILAGAPAAATVVH